MLKQGMCQSKTYMWTTTKVDLFLKFSCCLSSCNISVLFLHRNCLLYALNNCPKTAQRNIQLILTSLIPVNMLLGVMPTERMGRQYNVMEYILLGQAVVRGDLKAFEQVRFAYITLFEVI